MAAKKSAVEKVIAQLESEKAEIDRTITRLRQANAAAIVKRTRKPKIEEARPA